MTTVTAHPKMSAMHRKGIWGFIALLAALAFLRSLSPENTVTAVRGLVKSTSSSNESERAELQRMRDDLKRETIALERLRKEMDDKRDLIKKFEEFQRAERAKEAVSADHVMVVPPANDPDALTRETVTDGSAAVDDEGRDRTDGSGQEPNEDEEKDSAVIDGNESNESADEDDLIYQLLDGECPTVIAIESSKSGLGTQIEHLISMLSVSFAVQNACVVLPPINSYDSHENFRPVAFREIFDEDEFTGTGVRLVPLSVCKTLGVSDVFDDSGAKSAIVKNFAAFVQETDPQLAEETTLVHKESKGYRFKNGAVVNGDVTEMARYITKKRGIQDGRKCIGFGRMRAEVAINLDILEHLRPAGAIAEYVFSKYPAANQTMFVKLRWNKSYCERVRTEPGTVCIFSDNVLATEEYVRSIAYTAQQAGASFLYLSMPAYIPDDVSEYISTNLKVLEPVLLDVDGDLFTANLIEHELAVRSKVFVPDGGAWGDTAQLLRSSRNSVNFRNGYDSKIMVQEWKDAGWPADSHFLVKVSQGVGENVEEPEDAKEDEQAPGNMDNELASATDSMAEENAQQEERAPDVQDQDAQDPNVERTGTAPEPVVHSYDENSGQHSTLGHNRPTEYVPPPGYVPNEESDHHLLLNPEKVKAQVTQPESAVENEPTEPVPVQHGDTDDAQSASESQTPAQDTKQPNTITHEMQNINTRSDLPKAIG